MTAATATKKPRKTRRKPTHQSTHQTSGVVKPLENGREAWQCNTCESFNESTSTTCLGCSRERGAPSAAEFEQPTTDVETRSSVLSPDGSPIDIATNRLHPSGFNPRSDFDETKLKALADSLKKLGQLQNIVVRPRAETEGRYDIIAGERRWRAARIAKLETLRCHVIDVTDEEVVEMTGVENYERDQFNAIEEAEWFKAMLDSCGYTQTSLAKRLKISQGQVANRLRLLELPDDWRRRVISGEIPSSHARALVPVAKYSDVLKSLAAILKEEGPGTVEDWQYSILTAIENHSGPLKRGWDRAFGKHYEETYVKATKKQEESLDVIELKVFGQTHRRAMNRDAWTKLNEAAKKRSSERTAKDDAARSSATAGKPTPADARAKKKQQAEQFGKRLFAWKVAWFQERLPARLNGLSDEQLMKLLLYFAVQSDPDHRCGDLMSVVKDAGGKVKARSGDNWRKDVWASLTSAHDVIKGIVRDALEAWLKHSTAGYHADLDARDVEPIAVELGVEFEKEWTLDRSFLELHTKDQLAALAKQWKVKVTKAKRGELIDELLEKAADAKCPAELLKVKAVRL